jgi:serine/threonine protein kinase
MGNCANTDSKFDPTIAITLSDFDIKYPIGRGGFGRVWKVFHKKSGREFAMKEMRKDLVVSKRSVGPIMNERRLLGILKHPFIVNLHYAFQSLEHLYLVIDLMSGGDLRYYMIRNEEISEPQLQFMAACIIMGMEYLHSHNIVHRDIKPENLVFDSKGFLHITDFGIARTGTSDNSTTTSGTPGYMAPEVVCCQDHSIAVDYFALGVIMFEFIAHNRPYSGKTRREMREDMLSKQVQLKNDGKGYWSNNAIDIVNRLIQRKPEHRLGFHGPDELKKHGFFKDFDWEKLFNKEMKSPFKINTEYNFDHDYVMKKWHKVHEKVTPHNSQKLFAGFLYDETLFSLQSV